MVTKVMGAKILFILALLISVAFAQNKGKLIFQSDFSKPLDDQIWRVEIDSLPVKNSTVFTRKNALVLDTLGGVTVWLNKKLNGNIQIEYNRVVRMGKGSNDRVSDMNQFWMATDPNNDSLLRRKGKFQEYDNLSLYDIGVGGWDNKFTRFRKYTPTSKPVIQEYTDKKHLLDAEKVYHIKTTVVDGITKFWIDGELFFEYKDPSPLTSGYFGFRSLQSRQEIRNLKIYAID